VPTAPPARSRDDGSATTTAALLDTCTTQVEYAGVLAGASNTKGAKAVVDYLLSREFQDTIADTMYMYPVDPQAELPEEWQRFAVLPSAPHDLTPAQIGEGREHWLKTWSDAVGS
ncbi:MAG: thiamine ABC transporter substrate-binding protein, partial [Actinobacteria bacterium]|nr:thiamine ABC transporter substrate-binding protein [Actinomycetota bacterium]